MNPKSSNGLTHLNVTYLCTKEGKRWEGAVKKEHRAFSYCTTVGNIMLARKRERGKQNREKERERQGCFLRRNHARLSGLREREGEKEVGKDN